MGIFNAIVLAKSAGSMAIIESDFAQSRSAGFESVGDDCLRLDMLIAQQPPQQSQRSSSVATLLNNHVHDLAFVIDGELDPDAFSANRPDHHATALLQTESARALNTRKARRLNRCRCTSNAL